MRWIKRKHKLAKMHGQQKVVKKFLFWPVTLEYQTRWLESAEIVKQVCGKRNGYRWKSIKFKEDV